MIPSLESAGLLFTLLMELLLHAEVDAKIMGLVGQKNDKIQGKHLRAVQKFRGD